MNWFKKLARLLGQHGGVRKSSVTPRTTPTRLGVERMEDRLTPVVGATTLPTVLTPSFTTPFDGVVQVTVPRGGGLFSSGTGSLLSTGRHILTAAHVVDSIFDGDQLPDSQNVTVRFDMGSGPITMTSTAVTVHPNWRGIGNTDVQTINMIQSDLAIIELRELAPVRANRYDLFRDTSGSEVGREFQFVGYGRFGTGALGATQASDGQKRLGVNRYDSVAGFGTRTGTDYLNFDFDNGTGGNGLGEREAMTARGDSGGPGFVGSQIAGVTSWGDNGSRFGANGGMARVSTSQNFIDGILNQPDDIVIDLNSQEPSVWGNSVEVWRGPSDLWVKVNGVEDAIPLSEVRSLRIIGTDGNDHILFKGDVLDQAFSVRVDAGLGNDTLQAPDTWNRWEVTGANRGMLSWDVPFTSVENLRGGSSGDTFYISPGAQVSGSIDGGFGDMPDSIHYDTWTTGVTVNLSTGLATAVGTDPLLWNRGLFNIENAWGGEGRDTLIGNSAKNVLVGNGDIDRLEGGAGEDWLFGGAGNDTLDGGNDGVKDHLYGQTGIDTFVEHYNPVLAKNGITYWFPEVEDTDFDPATDVKSRRYW